jgi:viroplasmin and RNaseH domain-containing protein
MRMSSQVSKKVPNKKNQGRWYAVAKGRRIGVFSNRRDLFKSVTGFERAIWKRFRSEQAVHLWLAQCYRPEGADDEPYLEILGLQ